MYTEHYSIAPTFGVNAVFRCPPPRKLELVLTDDGRLQQSIANPKHGKEKRCWVQVEGIPDENDLEKLRAGVRLGDGMTRPARVVKIDPPEIWLREPPIRKRQHIPTSWLDLTITEGRNRQVRRMTAHIGFPTLRLVRYAVGEWSLGDLAVGEYRVIDQSPSTRAG